MPLLLFLTPQQAAASMAETSFRDACAVLSIARMFTCPTCESHEAYVADDEHRWFLCKPCNDEANEERTRHAWAELGGPPDKDRLIHPAGHWRLELPDGTVSPWRKL